MKRNFLKLIAAAGLLILVTSGCATLFKGSHQRIPIDSEPPGATVYINHERAGTTPMEIPLSRRTAHIVRIEKREFFAEEVILYTVSNEGERAFFRFSSDDYTGALNDLLPSEVSVSLRPRLLPARPGDDPEAEKEERLARARALRREGALSAADYEYVVRRIEEFYGASQ